MEARLVDDFVFATTKKQHTKPSFISLFTGVNSIKWYILQMWELEPLTSSSAFTAEREEGMQREKEKIQESSVR